MMKLIVAGSRGFTDKRRVFEALDKLYKKRIDLEIVSGLAKGPDTYGKEWAEKNEVPLHKFPADWDRFGKSAGYKRNEEMAKFGDALAAFYDGKSKGTMHMINLAKKHGLKVAIIFN